MKPDYIYTRGDGGTTTCYGKILTDSNFQIACENEFNDGVWTDNTISLSWDRICLYLETHWDRKIEEIVTI